MTDNKRDLGPQPIAGIMAELGLTTHDLVKVSPGMTHKRVARACKGRRLTKRSQNKVCDALNRAADQTYKPSDLFTYAAKKAAKKGSVI